MATISKRKSVISSLSDYFQASFQELKKVTWPTKNRAIRLTFLVLGFCLVTAIILGILDYGFGLGHKALLDIAPSRPIQSLPVDVGAEQPFESMPVSVTDSEGNVIDVSTEGSPVTITENPVNDAGGTVEIVPSEETTTAPSTEQ